MQSTSCESGSPGGSSSRGGSSVVVVARVRPRLAHESKQPECIEALPDRQTVLLCNGHEDKQFVLDQVFDSRQKQQGSETDWSADDDQSAFFRSFGNSLVEHSLHGYNVCLFAYGHTGSGKTYTVLGDAGGSSRGAATGLLPRFLHQLFQEQARVPGLENWRCSCEFFEVYNEQIWDLLQPAQTQRARKVHCHPKHGARIEGLTMSVVNSVDDVLDLLNFGNQMRTVATTTMNARSSRSHAFFTFKYEAKCEAAIPGRGQGNARKMQSTENQPCASTVTFVDLAGREERERLANNPGGMQYREMCSINTSLFHLAHLISKISSGQIERGSLSEFRNSKVTMLLSQALSGNSRTAVVATLSPLKSAFEDSLSTLNFAASAKRIKTKPVINARTPSVAVSELENEVIQLKRELVETKTRNIEKEQELQSATSWISYYKRSWEDAVARTEQQKLARTRSAARLGLASSTRGWASRTSVSGTLSQDGADVDIDLGLPFLTKLCDDPALQGCCNFPLDRPCLQIGSKEGSCDIVLQGIGITRQVCAVRYDDDGTVLVEALHGDLPEEGLARVLVNGQALQDSPRPMAHGDSLILGYAHAFRLVDPTPERVRQAGSSESLLIARATVPKLDVASAVEEVQALAELATAQEERRRSASLARDAELQLATAQEEEVSQRGLQAKEEEMQRVLVALEEVTQEAATMVAELAAAQERAGTRVKLLVGLAIAGVFLIGLLLGTGPQLPDYLPWPLRRTDPESLPRINSTDIYPVEAGEDAAESGECSPWGKNATSKLALYANGGVSHAVNPGSMDSPPWSVTTLPNGVRVATKGRFYRLFGYLVEIQCRGFCFQP